MVDGCPQLEVSQEGSACPANKIQIKCMVDMCPQLEVSQGGSVCPASKILINDGWVPAAGSESTRHHMPSKQNPEKMVGGCPQLEVSQQDIVCPASKIWIKWWMGALNWK